tara:strand:+ start:3288 stop:3614 length:327 start_codon:yes stop_codon:yes gene_type:complete
MEDKRPILTTSWVVLYNPDGEQEVKVGLRNLDLITRICEEEKIERGNFDKFDRIFRDENGFYAIEMADRARKIDPSYDYGPGRRFKDRRSWLCSTIKATQDYGVIRKR